jgi:hypothetical protein
MRRVLTIVIGFGLAAFAFHLTADDSAGGGLDDFTTPILRLPTPALKLSEAAPNPDPPSERPRPRMSLGPAVPSIGSELASGGPSIRYSASPALDRRTERLRDEWAAQDARRLERLRLEDGVWNRAVNTVFPEPVVIRAGYSEMSGGLINAIKRRNPFCLLNPVFFSFSF